MATKIQQILEANPDSKILFSEWLTSQGLDAITLGTSRYMAVPTGKYIAKYNMTIPKELVR